MDIKGIDQIYYGQLQSLDAADKQIFQLDAQEAGQNIEGGKPLAFRLVQPDNADQTRAADNRATRENLFRVLSDAKGLDTEFVNMLRSRLGIAENGTAAGDQALSALDAREVINLAKAKSADLDGMLELGKTLRKVQFDANVKSVLRQTLSREANNPVVIDFLDPSKQPPSLNALTKLCKLATMVKLPNASWESDLAVAYLKGFSATITDEIKLCGSLENPLVDEDKALLEATKQGQRDYETEQKALEEPKADEPKADEPKAEEPKADEPKADEENHELPKTEDQEHEEQKIETKNESKSETEDEPKVNEEEREEQKIETKNESKSETEDEPKVNEEEHEEQKNILKPDEPKTEVHQPETTMVNEPVAGEVRQEKTDEVDEPVVIVPKQKTPEDRELDKLLDAVVRLNARRITDPKAEDVPKVAKNVEKDRVYKNALSQMKEANELLAEVGKLSVEDLVNAWKSAGKVGDKDYTKAFSRKDRSPESICWAVKKALEDQKTLSALPQSVEKDKKALMSAIQEMLARVGARADALQELVDKLEAGEDFVGAGVTVAEWMAQKSHEKVNNAEVNALRDVVRQDEGFSQLLRDLEEMSHGGVDAKKPTNLRIDLRDRLAVVEKSLRDSGKAESQLAKDLLGVLAEARRRIEKFNAPRVSETSKKVLLGLKESMFGETIKKLAATSKTSVFKYILRNNTSCKSCYDAFNRFISDLNAYAANPTHNKLKMLKTATGDVLGWMGMSIGGEFSTIPQKLDVGKTVNEITNIKSVVVHLNPETHQPPEQVEGLSAEQRNTLINGIDSGFIPVQKNNTALFMISDLIRGKKTGIPEHASDYEEKLIAELCGAPDGYHANQLLFGDVEKIVQSVKSFIRIGSRLADEEFCKALEHADDQDVLERVVVDQPISEVAVLRAIGGAGVQAEMCETECTDENRRSMESHGNDTLVTYSLNGHEEKRIFRSESVAAFSNQGKYEKLVDNKILSSSQLLSNLSVAVGETAMRLGAPEAATSAKLAICNGKFGVLMPYQPGANAKAVVDACNNEANERKGGLNDAGAGMFATVVKDGYDSSNQAQRKLIGSMAKGYVDMMWVDHVAGVIDRDPEKYSIAFNDGRATVTGTSNHMSFSTYKTGLTTYHLSAKNGGLPAFQAFLKADVVNFKNNPLIYPGVKNVQKNDDGGIVELDIELADDTPEFIRSALAEGLNLRGGGQLPPYMSKAMSEKLNNTAEMNALKTVWRKMMDKSNYDAAVLRLEELQNVLASGKVQVLDNDDAWADADVIKKMMTHKKSENEDHLAISMTHSTYFSSDFNITKVDGVEVNPAPQPAEPKPAH